MAALCPTGAVCAAAPLLSALSVPEVGTWGRAAILGSLPPPPPPPAMGMCREVRSGGCCNVDDLCSPTGCGFCCPLFPCRSFLSPQGCNVMEDQDLRDIGIGDPQHRRKLLQAARSLPKVSTDTPHVKQGGGTAQHGCESRGNKSQTL